MSECACGAQWMPDRLTHWFLKVQKDEQCFFHEACLQHDIDYANGVPRKEADDKFLRNMINLAVEKDPTPAQFKRALMYHSIVTSLGFMSYWKANGTFK